jgi:hypothetical protein
MREEMTQSSAPSRIADGPTPANGSGAQAAAANGEGEAPPWAAFSAARGRLVRFVIVFSIALTLLAAASIYWRWAKVYEPTSYITIMGNEALEGTQVLVESPNYPESKTMVILSKENNYVTVIFLSPGSYTVTATHNGEQLAKGPFTISGRNTASLNLTARRPAAGAGSGSGAGRAAGAATPISGS